MAKKQTTSKTVEALKHDEATRKNIPTAEYQSVMQKNERDPVRGGRWGRWFKCNLSFRGQIFILDSAAKPPFSESGRSVENCVWRGRHRK